MIKKVESLKMGKSNLGWLNSIFHFSFAEYYNPDNINFGVLRVINDDLVKSGTGFDTHPHKDMEIVSYVIDGELTHADSMNNKYTLTRGQVQYMSAGTGVWHSEHNFGEETLRFLQIWIFPDDSNYSPNYGDYRFNWDDRVNKWLHIVSGENGDAPIKIHQDVNINVIELEKGRSIGFDVKENRQAYLVQIEGDSIINGIEINAKDGLESREENLMIEAKTDSHIMILEMKLGD